MKETPYILANQVHAWFNLNLKFSSTTSSTSSSNIQVVGLVHKNIPHIEQKINSMGVIVHRQITWKPTKSG